jgi:hypothetical protein
VGENQLIFQLDLAFFGLTSKIAQEFRKSVFDQIHQIVFHGKGGYDWGTVYNMPIWLRKFTFNKIKEWYENQKSTKNEDSWVNNSEAKQEALKNKNIKVPTYFTKSSKK